MSPAEQRDNNKWKKNQKRSKARWMDCNRNKNNNNNNNNQTLVEVGIDVGFVPIRRKWMNIHGELLGQGEPAGTRGDA